MTAKAKPGRGAKTATWVLPQTIAWQRITVRTPESWSMAGISGDERSGSIRADKTGAEEDAILLGVEVRWSQIKQDQTGEMLDKRIKPLLDATKNAAKRAKIDPEIETITLGGGAHPERGVVREFAIRAGSAAVGRIWRCSECGRLVIAQVYSRPGAGYKELARQVLDSIECHNREIGWTRWALYGLDVSVPADYALAGQQLMSIYLELRFARGRGGKLGETLTVEQWSAANVQLKGSYLDEWFETKGQSLQRTLALDKDETTVHGHNALASTARRGGPIYWLTDAPRTLAQLQLPAREYAAVGWECAESNKVYLIQTVSVRRGDVAREVADRAVCHDSAEA